MPKVLKLILINRIKNIVSIMDNVHTPLFKLLKLKYDYKSIKQFRKVLSLSAKIEKITCSIDFLKNCISNKVSPKYIYSKIKKTKLKNSRVIENAFIKDFIAKNERQLNSSRISLDMVIKNLK